MIVAPLDRKELTACCQAPARRPLDIATAYIGRQTPRKNSSCKFYPIPRGSFVLSSTVTTPYPISSRLDHRYLLSSISTTTPPLMHTYLSLHLLLLLFLSITPCLSDPICTLPCQTDNLLLRRPMAKFLAAKRARSPAALIWTDDGCSNAPDQPNGYNFLPSCYRHDFGYRNYKAQGRFNEPNRETIDNNMKRDLYNECDKFDGRQAFKRVDCRRIADLYYVGVRAFGNLEVPIPAIPGF